jgi:hypothetical protein
MKVSRYRKTRFWAVTDAHGTLICVCVYRKGAVSVARRLRGDPVPAPYRCRRHARRDGAVPQAFIGA